MTRCPICCRHSKRHAHHRLRMVSPSRLPITATRKIALLKPKPSCGVIFWRAFFSAVRLETLSIGMHRVCGRNLETPNFHRLRTINLPRHVPKSQCFLLGGHSLGRTTPTLSRTISKDVYLRTETIGVFHFYLWSWRKLHSIFNMRVLKTFTAQAKPYTICTFGWHVLIWRKLFSKRCESFRLL